MAQIAEPLDQLLTLDDVAGTLQISRRGVQRLVSSGELHPIRIGQLTRFFPADVRTYLDARAAAAFSSEMREPDLGRARGSRADELGSG